MLRVFKRKKDLLERYHEPNMQSYYIAIPFVLLAVVLYIMWRDIRTLKSRVTDVVTQHNNVKLALDRHDSMLASQNQDPFTPAMLSDLKFEPIAATEDEDKEEPVTPTVVAADTQSSPPPAPMKAPKRSKATASREKES